MIGWGHFFRVSGLGRLVSGSGVQVQAQVQEICHLSSVIDAAIFPVRVAGGGPGWRVAGLIHSALNSVLNAALNSALIHRLGHLSSIQPSMGQQTMS